MSARIFGTAYLLVAIAAGIPAFAAPSPLDPAFDAVMQQYLALHGHLTTDHFDDASRKTAAALNQAAVSLQAQAGAASSAAAAIRTIVDRSAELTKASLPLARGVFASLSEGIDTYIKSHYRGSTKYYRFFCDMVKKPWAYSKDKPILNPFYDASMRNCGRLVP